MSLSTGYLDRFSGLGRLYGTAALERLAASRVCVIGLGGVGSWTVEALARSGIGSLTLVDLDDVCITNTNRQLPALTGTVGRTKADVLKERIHAINPECSVTARLEFFTQATAESILAEGFSAVVDAIDSRTNKALLIAECVRRGLPCVTVGGAGGKREATLVRAGDLGESQGDELLRLVRKKLRRDHGFAHGEKNRYGVRCVYSSEHPVFPWADGSCATEPEPGANLKLDCASGFGTAAHITGVFGLAAAGEVLKQVVGQAAG